MTKWLKNNFEYLIVGVLFAVLVIMMSATVVDKVKAQVPGAQRIGPESFIVGPDESKCYSYNVLKKKAAESYGEFPTVDFKMAGAIHTVWINPEDGSWTMTRLAPDGKLCIYAFGKSAGGHKAPGDGL